MLHVISGLEVGGAELSLVELLSRMRSDYEFSVLSLTPHGQLEARIRALGVPVLGVALKRNPLAWLHMKQVARRFKPELIQGWMYHGNLLASTLRSGPSPVIWSVRHSLGDFENEKRLLRTIVRLGGSGVWRPNLVVYNSHAGSNSHAKLGYDRFNSCVISNGVDTSRFRACPERRRRLRAKLQCDDTTLLVGYVGRAHPGKNLPLLFRTFARLGELLPTVRFAAFGRGLAGPSEVHFEGAVEDMAEVYPGLDLLVLSSREEGTPNVLLEAMAAEVPVVSTDVGDAARIVGRPELLAPVDNPDRLAAAAERVLRDHSGRAALGHQLRQRVVENFSIERCIDQYANTYQRMIQPS